MERSRVVRTLLFLLLLSAARNAATAQELAQDAAAPVLQQIAALRAHDFTGAYALSSKEMRRTFSPSEFEWMVKRAHPEVASSTYAFVVRTHEAAGYTYVTVKVHGRNGQNVEALYEMVREGGGWKINALSSRRDEGLL
jgi:ABC-type transporter MlaC component